MPCCKCMACRIARTSEWTTRIMHELIGKIGCFITLTYDDEHLPENGTLVKEHFQKFMKRLRRFIEPTKIKYYGCGEYGENTNRPHYHAIIINWMPGLDRLYRPSGKYLVSRDIEKLWMYGNNTVGYADRESIQYVCGYIRKKLYGKDQERYDGRLAPFQMQSIKLGCDYAMSHKEMILERGISRNGKNVGVPRYYIKKLVEKDTVEEYYYKKRLEELRQKEIEPYLDKNNEIMREWYIDKASDRERRRIALEKAEEIFKNGKI